MWPNSRWNALWRIATLLQETNGLLRELLERHGGTTTPRPLSRSGPGPRPRATPAGPESLTYPEERARLAALQEEARRRAELGLPPV